MNKQHTFAHITNPKGHDSNQCTICAEIALAVKSILKQAIKALKDGLGSSKDLANTNYGVKAPGMKEAMAILKGIKNET